MKKKLITLTCLITLSALPIVAMAQAEIEGILNNAINKVVWPLFFSAMVVMFIWTGFLFVTAHGEPAKITKARGALLWSIIGGGLGVLAFSAYNIIKYIFVN